MKGINSQITEIVSYCHSLSICHNWVSYLNKIIVKVKLKWNKIKSIWSQKSMCNYYGFGQQINQIEIAQDEHLMHL